MPTAERTSALHEAPLLEGEADRDAFLPFWNVDAVLKCPVVGICLTPEEQRRALKKSGLLSKKHGPFEIHEILVSCTNSENPLSRRVDALLKKKYTVQAQLLRHLESSLFLRHWKTAFASGDFAAALWAAASRPDLPETSRRAIFGDIHMSMHGALDETAALRVHLAQSRREREKGEERVKSAKLALLQLRKELDARQREQKRLSGALAIAELEKEQLRAEIASLRAHERLHTLEAENARLRTVLTGQAGQLLQAQEQQKNAERQLAGMAQELESRQQLNLRLKEEMRSILQALTASQTCDNSCPSFAGCKKRVLIVGGMARMESLYRQLVEGNGGSLEYHDGYLGGGVKQLEQSLQRADIVLCPVNCNSHGACAAVKSLGKKYNKPVYMMSNFSLNAVSRVMERNGAGLPAEA